MQPMSNQIESDNQNLEDEGVIDLDSYFPEQQEYDPQTEKLEEENDGIIDLKEYSDSGEEEKATWGDLAKDLIIQPVLGTAAAFTWPLDILKMGMVGEGLSDIDELESAFKKAGKPFDRDEYIRAVSNQSEYVPTQDFLEKAFEDKTGISLEAKSNTGKTIKKFFTLLSLLKGKGLTKEGLKKAAKGAAVGSGTTQALKAAGVNETASEFIGDITAGGATALTKEARVLTPEIAALEKTAAKHGLPFPEYLTKESSQLVKPKISDKRKLALQKEIGMSSQEAIDNIIAGRLNVKNLKNQGADLEVLTEAAYDEVSQLAKAIPKKVSTKNIVKDIDAEIARIKSLAPSPSDADKAAIGILESEKNALTNEVPKQAGKQIVGPNGQPIQQSSSRVPKEESTEKMVEQIKKYNSNVSQIYKRSEFSGREDSVRSAYAFLNNSIRNTVEAESGTEIRQAMKAADSLYAEKSKLDRVESLISKSFINGDYNPKKLQSLLNSKQGLIVRRELGDQALNEIRDIANYGDKAVKATNQLAKSSRHVGDIAEWGPLAGYLLHKMPQKAGLLIGAKAIGDRIRGYLLTRPAARTAYKDIIKNAANGSFKSMASDFSKLEDAVSKDFGSVDEFFKAMHNDLELIED